MGLGGVAIAILPSIMCLKLTFSDGLGGDEFMIAHEPVCPNQSSEHVSDTLRSNHQHTKPVQPSNSRFTYSSGLTCRQAPSSRNRR